MEEVIRRLLEGNFEYEKGSLDFSCTKLELTIRPGECREGSFFIYGEEGRYTQGNVLSSDGRMECLTAEFVGCREEIFFRFHGGNLEEGDVVKGEFHVISNQGEYYLPFVVNVAYTVLETSLGNVKNLFHFANLAKTSPEEAVSLFYSGEFARIFNGSDRQYYEYYLGMSAYAGNEQNVEEFLIGINKKQKIEYLIDTEEIRLEDVDGIAETGFTVTRNGWGYTRLLVETQGDFLYTDKKELTDSDFSGNSCRVSVYVDSRLLHDGNNFGGIVLSNSYGNMQVKVLVKRHASHSRRRQGIERKRLVLQLMEFYQAFRMKKISSSTWLKESRQLVEKMTAGNDKDISARLFQAQLLITEERYNEAQWVLDHAAGILEETGADAVTEAYYLYLTTLLCREEEYVDRVTEQISYIFKRNRNEWRIAWLLLYLSEEYNRSFSKKWMFLEEQFNRGCKSPIIYIEALLLMNLNPSLLMKLGDFEKQLLWYGAKHEMLHKDVILQFLYLVQKEREYSSCLYRILLACYRIKPQSDVLQEICRLLIKGGKSGKEYFHWYKRGVEQELRITRLYEYFMMSVDVNSAEALPKMVLMYFSYQNSLQYEQAAFLYANIYRNRENYPELYQNYQLAIEQFVQKQLLNRRINRDLAYLYRHVLHPGMLTEETACALAEILFMNMIVTPRTDIRYVVVYQPGRNEPIYYSVADGKAFVSLPVQDSRILFEDGSHNRYMASVSHTTEKLMLPGRLVKLVAPLVGDARDLNLYMCTNGQDIAEITEENEYRFRFLLDDEEISDKLKQKIAIRLVTYYYENDKIRALDDYLEQAEPERFTRKDRGEMIKYLIIRGHEEKAYQWICRFGPYDMEPKALMRLCSLLIKDRDFMEDAVLTAAAWHAFRAGKYDDACLRYLSMYFRGMTKELRNIFKAAQAFGVETYELCEKMLIQMLFTGSFVGEKMEIFRTYVSGGAKTEVEEAFLCQCAYEYFVKDRVTAGYVFEEIAGMYKRGENLHRVCKLGFIKYYSENKSEITDAIQEILLDFITELQKNRIYLKMFAEFQDMGNSRLNLFSDRTFVEYKAYPGARAVLHYCMEYAEGEVSAYQTEDMQEVYGGVCFKDFVLFFGERLQYYIMEERDGNEQLTESATIQKSDTGGESAEGKFNLVNDLSISSTLQDYETVDKLLEEYEYKEYLQNRLFRLV